MSASVVSMSAATEAAFCSAVRTTLVGSMTPALTRSSYSPVAPLQPNAPLPSLTLLTTIEPSKPPFCGDLTERLLEARRMMLTPYCCSPSSLSFSSDRQRADERHAAARDDALFDGRAGRVERVLDAGLLLLHLASRWPRRP